MSLEALKRRRAELRHRIDQPSLSGDFATANEGARAGLEWQAEWHVLDRRVRDAERRTSR